MTPAYQEFVEFIARGSTPHGVVEFLPSDSTKTRVTDLIQRQKMGGLTSEENNELNCYLQTERLMRLAKARARQNLGSG